MTEHVPYIDKTREYYQREGYARPYSWAQNMDGPFSPLTKPLARCRLMLVSTASIVLLDDAGRPTETMPVMGGRDLEVFPVPSDIPLERLRSTSEDHDRAQTDMSDLNAYFPLERLREFVAEGVLGSLASEALRLVPNYSQRKTLTVDAPEVLRRAREQEVDAVVLSPV